MATSMKAFYVAGRTTIQDVADLVDGVWRGRWSGQTLDEMRGRVPGVVLVDYDKACDAIAAIEAQYAS